MNICIHIDNLKNQMLYQKIGKGGNRTLQSKICKLLTMKEKNNIKKKGNLGEINSLNNNRQNIGENKRRLYGKSQ